MEHRLMRETEEWCEFSGQIIIESIVGPVLLAFGQSFHKITAKALRVCSEIVRFVRSNIEGYTFDIKPYVYPIYNATMARLKDKDQDKEVKECAISCMGLFVSTFGDHLKNESRECLPILEDRMGNEITRLTVVKVVFRAIPLVLCYLVD